MHEAGIPSNIVIAIEREYGSGGRTIGKMLAKRLGINYYNKELSRLASELSGINEALFIDADEMLQNKLPLKANKPAYKGDIISPDKSDYTSAKNLFNFQAQVLKNLAESESCIIIGRCANYVLRDYENVVSVFVHAPMDFLIEQSEKIQSFRGKELEKFIIRTNKNRSAYYNYYSGKEWSDARAYDLCLNSKKLGFEKCADEILEYIKVRYS